MSFSLRPYQQETTDAIRADWQAGASSVMVELATGLGKTEVFTDIARTWEEGRVLVVCPIIQLIGQAAKKICQRTGIMPDIEQGQLRSNESEWARNQFIVASKQTLTKERRDGSFRYQRLNDVGLVVVDECHLSCTKPYESMLNHFKSQGARVLGVTATAKRHDKLALGNIYEKCSYQYGIVNAVPDGWLVPAKTSCIQLETLDLQGVATSGGDFKAGGKGGLNERLEDEKTLYEIADVTYKESGDLKTVVYCSSVAEAKGVAYILCDVYKKKAAWICGDKKLCSDQRRAEVLHSFEQDPDGIQFVCNVGVLTTGWDFPGLQHIVQARPTKSIALYTQIFGRGTRPLPGVVDFKGSTPESRCSAIAASAKPHFRMTDLVDNSMAHKIVTCLDVLGGRMGIEAIERAKKELAEASGPIEVDAVLQEAQRKIEEERELAERRRLARVRGEATYHKLDVDPFDATRRSSGMSSRRSNARMLFGKHKGKPLSEIPTSYLTWVDSLGKKGWFADAVRTEIAARKNPLTAAINSGLSKREKAKLDPNDLLRELF